MSEYNHTVDAKGRMIIPAKFREELGLTFIITRGIDSCILVYAKDEWQKLVDTINEQSMVNRDARKFTRFLIGGAAEVEPDGQGRILIPQYLREYANIAKDTVAVGMGNHAEIWGKESYMESMNSTDVNEIADKLDEMGIRI